MNPAADDAAPTLNLVTDTVAFEALRDDWQRLFESTREPHVFRSFGWCWNAWRLVAEPRGYALRLVTGRIDGVLVLVWPMMEKDHVLRMVSGEILEYRDLLVRSSPLSKRWIGQAWKFVLESVHPDVVMFQNLRLPNFVASWAASQRGARAIGGGWCPIIRLDRFDGWDAYARTLPRSLASDQRRQWKRVRHALPGLAFRVVDSPADVEPAIDWITRHKIAWAKQRQRIVWHESDAVSTLLKQVALDNLAAMRLVLATLADGDTTISAGFGYVYGNEFHFHAFAYDEAYATYSPSRLFLECIVRECFARGVRTFDFMPGDETYKRIWSTDYVRTASYIAPGTLRGAAYLAVSAFLTRLRRTDRRPDRGLGRWTKLIPPAIRSNLRELVERAPLLKELAVVRHALELKHAPDDPLRAAAAESD